MTTKIKKKPQSLYDTALRLAQAETKPVLDSIDTERARVAAEHAAQIKNAQGFSEGLAGIYGDIAPGVEKTYADARGATGALGKGFSDAAAAARDGSAADLESFLSKAGIPSNLIAEAKAHAAGGGLSDVQYGVGGYFPAAGLTREGAAFTAAAKALPALAGNKGLETTAVLGKAASDADLQYASQVASERGKIPTLARQLYDDMLNRQRQDRSLSIQEQYLSNTQRGTTASVTGYDPVTGLPTPSTTSKTDAVTTAAATARGKSVKAREDAFASAQTHIFDDAKGLVHPMSMDEQIAWVAAHPGMRLADAPKVQAPQYKDAAKQLFAKYKFLLRYASQSGQGPLKRRLNQIIRDALDASGVQAPAPKKSKTVSPKRRGR